MDVNEVKAILPLFEDYYRANIPLQQIRVAQDAFRTFWLSKIMNSAVPGLSEFGDLDPIIRLLDKNGKRNYEYKDEGERKNLMEKITDSERQYGLQHEIEDTGNKLIVKDVIGTATCLVTQKEWYAIFIDLKTHSELREKMDQIFNQQNASERISLINELYELNSKYNNMLMAKSTALNAILSCYDPNSYLRVVSLNDRRQIIEFFELGVYPESKPYGERIIVSNELLKSFNQKIDMNYDSTKLSYLFYFDPVLKMWRTRGPSTRTTYRRARETPEKTYETEHIKTQYILIDLGKNLGCDVWVASNDRGKSFQGVRFDELTLESLPSLGLSEEARRIVEMIDVIWLHEGMPAGAFEIETTTSIYSGLLRLSDLLTLVPAVAFPIYIVSSRERRDRVKEQLLRPTFKRLKLPEKCKFIEVEELEKDYENIKRFGAGPKAIDKIAKAINLL
jgi:hypothetical protein